MSPFAALLFGGAFWSPVDLASPHATLVMRARMLEICDGMTRDEVLQRLGLVKATPRLGLIACYSSSSGFSDFSTYAVRPNHHLLLSFVAEQGVYRLRTAELKVDPIACAAEILGFELAIPSAETLNR